jgi:hypothetical protein
VNIERELSRFDATCDRWVAGLDEYEEASWRKAPAPGVWSMSQVYTHILEVGALALDRIRVCHERAEGRPKKTLAGKLVYLIGGLPPIRVKAPKSVNNAPAHPESKDVVRDALLSFKARMKELAPTVTSARGVATHPIMGKLTAPEWFIFMEMHLRHHLRQKKRIDQMLAKG